MDESNTMKRYLLRWPVWLLLAAITVVAIVPSLTYFHATRISIVRATGTPTVTLSSKIVQFGDTITITAQGFSSSETVQLQLMDSATDTWNLGTLSCDSIGTCTELRPLWANWMWSSND